MFEGPELKTTLLYYGSESITSCGVGGEVWRCLNLKGMTLLNLSNVCLESLSPLEKSIARYLQKNSCINHVDLANHFNCNLDAVIIAVKKLLDLGIVGSCGSLRKASIIYEAVCASCARRTEERFGTATANVSRSKEAS